VGQSATGGKMLEQKALDCRQHSTCRRETFASWFAWLSLNEQGLAGGEHRSRDVVSPPVPLRRIYGIASPSAQGARGLAQGRWFDRAGALVASTM
jgi:hypothetical protein